MSPVQIRLANYRNDAPAIRTVREAVFVLEQGIPAELEWDNADAQAQHVLALVDSNPIGTGRLLADGRIGRMAVLPQWRGHGVGTALLKQLLELARQGGQHKVYVSAQQAVNGFYQRHGFQPQGEPYREAGILHIKMQCELA
jgi:predicted GNAT family N-acyltransferase